MSDMDRHILNQIRRWVHSGFFLKSDVQRMLGDLLEEGADEPMLRRAVGMEFKRKFEFELEWPAVTDCERLSCAFAALDVKGILCLENAGYTSRESHGNANQILASREEGRYHGYCYYHGQDVELSALGEQYLMLGYDSCHDDEDGEERTMIAELIVSELRDAGLTPEWNGEFSKRIGIDGFQWRRRMEGSPGSPDLQIRISLQNLLDSQLAGRSGGFVVFEPKKEEHGFVQYSLDPNGLMLCWPIMDRDSHAPLELYVAHLESEGHRRVDRQDEPAIKFQIDRLMSGEFMVLDDGLYAQVGRNSLSVQELTINLFDKVFGLRDMAEVKTRLSRTG